MTTAPETVITKNEVKREGYPGIIKILGWTAAVAAGFLLADNMMGRPFRHHDTKAKPTHLSEKSAVRIRGNQHGGALGESIALDPSSPEVQKHKLFYAAKERIDSQR